MVPSVVVNVMTVPLCGGVPDASSTCAMIVVVAFTDIAVVAEVSVIVEPDGARRGTRSQPAAESEAVTAANQANQPRRDIMKVCNILSSMHLHGQALGADPRGANTSRQAGYAMVALLVSLSVMAVLMTVAMPAWKTLAKREKEAELIFRGQQYVRAIDLFGRRFPGALPPNLDVLVEQKFLRKKFKDPITGDDFEPVRPDAPLPGAVQAPQRGGRASQPPSGMAPSTRVAGAVRAGEGAVLGIIGVVSKSNETSLRIFNGRSKYNEWIFQHVPRTQAPGTGGAPGSATPGQRGGQPQRGGPGQPGIGGPGQRGIGGPGQRGIGGPGQRGATPFGGRGSQPGDGRGGRGQPGGERGPARGQGPFFPPQQSPQRPPGF
jgi:type II secretory pathway pseudopilin PulG